MKKLTKRLMGVAMSVATICMMGCNWNQDANKMINFDAPGNTATVKYTNETKNYSRGWATFNTAHKLDSVLITIHDQKKENVDDGNMGFVFGQTKNPDKTYNFYVATLNYQTNIIRTYISYYEGVDPNYLEGPYQNFMGIDGDNVAKENCIEPKSGVWKEIGFTPEANGDVKVYIKLTFDENNGYKIEYFNVDDNGKPKGDAILTKESLIYGLGDKVDNKYKILDARTGCYAMVKPGKTLNGTWNFDKDEQQLNPIIAE